VSIKLELETVPLLLTAYSMCGVFRQNRYDARVSVVPVDGIWKIRTVEVIGEGRVR